MQPKFNPERYAFLKGKLSLDLLRLDEEISEIGVLVQDASENAAYALEIQETAKDDLKVAMAVACNELRKIPTEGGKTRSEAQIGVEFYLNSTYHEAMSTLSDARLDADLWGSLVEGFRSKSIAMNNTADLVKSGYLSTSSILDKRREQMNAQRKPIERKTINN